tara:strand:+ start:796 stop:1317 length:522 start_codon:yes stop_codon:yes gene_type:complete
MIRSLAKGVYRWSYAVVSSLVNFFPDSPFGNRLRGLILGRFMKGSRKNLSISKSTNILYPYNVVIGDDVFIGFNSWINAQGNVVIEDYVILGPFVVIATGNHTFDNGSYRFGLHEKRRVKINEGAWIAAHSSIVPGVEIGARSVVAAGSVVISAVDQDSLFAGNPAKIVKRLR